AHPVEERTQYIGQRHYPDRLLPRLLLHDPRYYVCVVCQGTQRARTTTHTRCTRAAARSSTASPTVAVAEQEMGVDGAFVCRCARNSMTGSCSDSSCV